MIRVGWRDSEHVSIAMQRSDCMNLMPHDAKMGADGGSGRTQGGEAESRYIALHVCGVRGARSTEHEGMFVKSLTVQLWIVVERGPDADQNRVVECAHPVGVAQKSRLDLICPL